MQKDVIITIGEKYLTQIASVAGRLKQDGLQISDIKDYGLIMGRSEANKITSIRNYEEVAGVEEEQYVQLPDPGSDIQ